MKRIHFLKLFVLLPLLFCLSFIAKAEVSPKTTIILLTENYPPYNMSVNDKNFARGDNIDGLSTDIVREMFKRANIKYRLSLRFPWSRIYKLTLQKRDYGLFSTSRTEARENLFKWVGPLASSDWVFLALNKNPVRVNTLNAAKKFKVGGYKGDATANFLEERGFNLITSFRDNENVKKLVDGRIDLWATGDLSGRYLAQLEGVTGLKTVFTIKKSQLYLAFNKDTSDEVINLLQNALDEMVRDGSHEQMVNDYM
ncbi:substrate-binding periplasmic protein [Spartinivicinus ruber]|uniref:substrate-binding periplasmic protein n=1 Tax=Spartinivicinus ruber TaxID=2683272 RepID=UPI0013D8BB43|nr:ABC transporter substrate-binding protein [Spartinivicinus ruber]